MIEGAHRPMGNQDAVPPGVAVRNAKCPSLAGGVARDGLAHFRFPESKKPAGSPAR